MKKGVVLLSGGLDSTTVLSLAIEAGYTPYCLTFQYGQRHDREVAYAQQIVAQTPQVQDHKIVTIDLRVFGGSSLTSNIEVHKLVNSKEGEIPNTYVPARNTIFLSYALGYAESIQATDIFIGVNAVDYSNYPDCRSEFITAFEKLANLATKSGVLGDQFKIHAPLQNMSKPEIIKTGLRLGVDYSMTTSCYDPVNDNTACGQCEACQLRRNGFEQLNMQDPILYVVK